MKDVAKSAHNADMKRILLATALPAVLLLGGCGASSSPEPGATSAASMPATPGGNVIAPTMIDPSTATEVSVPLGSMVVFDVQDPKGWTAIVADPSVATFQAGGDQGGWTANPGLVPVAQGTTAVTATGPDGASHTFTLTVKGQVTDIMSPMPDLGVTPETTALADSLMGMSEGEAVMKVEATGRTIRIARRDKESFALTMDYRPDRINIEVDADMVTKVTVG